MTARIITLLLCSTILGVSISQQLVSQSTADQNLRTCLSGKYPALCNHQALTGEQLKSALAAEGRENLQLCLTGKYPALCDHSRLTPSQAGSVKEEERVENLSICSSGKYPALCNHDLLSLTENVQVQAAEKTENLKVCMVGRYPNLCNHSLLTTEQAKAVEAAERQGSSSRATPPSRTPAPFSQLRGPTECESGLWIESVEGDGKIIKLDDGSMWEVDDVDTVDTSLWLAADEVTVCHGKIINTDENESAGVVMILSGGSAGGRAIPTQGYAIEASVDDETFVINGEVFKAKTYCFNFDKGDRIKFIEGSVFGACASAKLLNLRTGKVCEVWCGD